MSALNFPGSPTDGQVYPAPNGVTYVWDGTNQLWRTQGGDGENVVFVSATAPVSPTQGKMWWNCDTGAMYIWYQDVDSGQWVPASSTNVGAITPGMDGDFDDIKVNSLNSGALGGFRNLLINGGFNVWQRGSGPEPLNSFGTNYLADRWSVRNTTGSGGTPSQQSNVGPGGNLYHRYVASGLTGGSYITHAIESQNIRPYYGKEMTLSVSSNYVPRFEIGYYDSSEVYVSLVLSTDGPNATLVPGTTDRYYINFTLPTAQMGITPDARGLEIVIYYGDLASPLPDGNYDTWEAQLEVGPVATDFEWRPYQTELALCQRYYYQQKADPTFLTSVTNGILWNNNSYLGAVRFPVTMRTYPTGSLIGPTGFSVLAGGFEFSVTGGFLQTLTVDACELALTVGEQASPGEGAMCRMAAGSSYWSVDAEF